MSVKVDLATLADTMADYAGAYLLTVSSPARPHAVAVRPEAGPAGIRVAAPGRRTLANLGERPEVTLLFPPRDVGGYSLIVDGRAVDEGDAVLVVPAHAVLHRPADHAAEATTDSSCGNDCVELPAS